MHGGPEYSSSSLTSFQTTVGYLQVQPSFNASAFAFLLAMRNSEANVSEFCTVVVVVVVAVVVDNMTISKNVVRFKYSVDNKGK